MELYFTNSLEKILKDGPVIHNKVHSGKAFKNEKVNLQIVIPPLNKFSQGDQELSYELLPDIVEGVQLYKVGHVPVGNISAGLIDEDIIKNQLSVYPDILSPINKTGVLILNPEEWSSLWVEIDLEKIKAHELLENIEFSYSTAKFQGTIQYKLTVMNLQLPEQKIIHTEWFHTDSLCHYYDIKPFSEEYWLAVDNYIQTAYDHSQNTILTPIFTPPIDTEENKERMTIQLVGISKDDQQYTFDFTKLTRWSDLVKNIGIEYLEFPPFFTQWGAKYTPKIIINENGSKKQMFGWHVPYDSPKYKIFLEAFLPALDKWIKENNWAGKVFFHVSDEPNEKSLINYQYGKELLQKNITTGIFIDALSEYEFYKKGLVDIPVAGIPSIDGFLEKEVDNLWCYYCGIHNDKVSNRYIAQKSRRTRIIGLQMYKYMLKGFLHWGYNFWFTQLSKKTINPYEVSDAGGGFPSGDAFVVYPGENYEPVPSIRLKIMNEAFQDIRACELLEFYTDRDTVLNIIDKYIPELDFYSHGDILQKVDLIRAEINQTVQKIAASNNKESKFKETDK